MAWLLARCTERSRGWPCVLFHVGALLVVGSVVALFWRSSLFSRAFSREVLHESRARLRARYSREARRVARRGSRLGAAGYGHLLTLAAAGLGVVAYAGPPTAQVGPWLAWASLWIVLGDDSYDRVIA